MCVYTICVASVPGLPRSVRVLIVRRRQNAHGTGEAWNRGYHMRICMVEVENITVAFR